MTSIALTPVLEDLAILLDNSDNTYGQEVYCGSNSCFSSKANDSDYEILFSFEAVSLGSDYYGFVSGSLEVKEECDAPDNFLELSLNYVSGTDVIDAYIRSGNTLEEIIIEVNGHDMRESLYDTAMQIIIEYKQLIKDYLLN